MFVKDGLQTERMVYNMLSSMEQDMNLGKIFGECGINSLLGRLSDDLKRPKTEITLIQ